MKRILIAAFALIALASNLQAEMPREPKVQQTIATIRTLASALEAYAADHGGYPRVEHYSELWNLLSPKYVAAGEPLVDGWGAPFVYRATSDGCHYRIVSGGADSAFAKPSLKMSPNPPAQSTFTDKSGDIIYQDNAFRRVPLGANDAFEFHEQSNFTCTKKKMP